METLFNISNTNPDITLADLPIKRFQETILQTGTTSGNTTGATIYSCDKNGRGISLYSIINVVSKTPATIDLSYDIGYVISGAITWITAIAALRTISTTGYSWIMINPNIPANPGFDAAMSTIRTPIPQIFRFNYTPSDGTDYEIDQYLIWSE